MSPQPAYLSTQNPNRPRAEEPPMTPDQQHRCTVQLPPDGPPYLAFAPATGQPSSYSNSLFTLDLRADATPAEALALADHVNRLLRGVSTTVF